MNHFKSQKKVIKKLDFDNCEVTAARTRNAFKKLLKSRMVSEYENEIIFSLQSQSHSESSGQVEEDKGEEKEVHSSPILFRKSSSQRKVLKTPSPVLIAKQKMIPKKRFRVQDSSKPSTSTIGETENTISPVFKSTKTVTIRKQKSENADVHESAKFKSPFLFASDDDYSAEECNIEDFDQDHMKETLEEYKISNFSSESTLSLQINSSQEQSSEILSMENERFALQTPDVNEDFMENTEELNSEGHSTECQRGGLVKILHELRKKQSSERRICDHNRKLMNPGIIQRTLCVIEAWKNATQLTLKCQHVDVSEDAILTDSDATDLFYVIISRDKGSYFKKIKRGTFLRITAPWQEITLPALNGTALLSVSYIELIDSPPDITLARTVLREVSVTKYKEDKGLLFHTILALNRQHIKPLINV